MSGPLKSGPPPTQLPPDIKETPPKRTGTRRDTSRATAARRRSLKPQIAGALMMMNLALTVIPPLRRDVLDEVEINALAEALDEQARQSPRFRKYLEAALTATGGGQLVGILVIVGARRASRHGALPAEVDGQLGALLALNAQAPKPAPPSFDEPTELPQRNGTG
jgi:hypothetical protein